VLQLTTLGRLSLANSAASVVGLSRRKLAILALLASAGDRGLRRDKLVAYLWPESSSNDARHSLEQLLYSLRRQLDARVFDGTDPLRLNPQVITSDLEAFHDAIRRGSDSEAIAGYRETSSTASTSRRHPSSNVGWRRSGRDCALLTPARWNARQQRRRSVATAPAPWRHGERSPGWIP
jgi:DNA-binding SARP family transcriptional activator